MKPSEFSRRRFLQGAGLAGTAALLPGVPVFAATQSRSGRHRPARNIIFLVVDGMGTGTLGLANHWMQRHEQSPTHWISSYRRKDLARGLQETASASSPVTDSAAAASAWGCGRRVPNRSVNVDERGRPLTPLYSIARESGKATGLVTTCRVTHATPAGFAANVSHRDEEETIARQYLEREVDVILGGGRRFFTANGNDLPGRFKAKDYQFADDRRSLRKVAGHRRLLGLFSEDHVPYKIDREHDAALKQTPGLPEMFSAALESLSQNKEGFVLQVEGGRVDHAAHANDPGAIVPEMLEFDRCIPLALAFQERHPDTLVIITTDHGTGGCQLNGWGPDYNDSGPALDRLNQFTASFEALANRFAKNKKFDADKLRSATGLVANGAQTTHIQAAIEENPRSLQRVLLEIFADQLLDTTAIGWTSHNHTGEFVELLAFGSGADAVPAFLPNNELFGIMIEALRLAV